MQWLINYFKGSVLIKVCGSYPERFLNLCAREGISFWDMHTEDIETFSIRIYARDFLKLPLVARKAACRVHILKKYGFFIFAKKFKKRKTLIFGALAFCMVAWIFTSFVWIIDIDGFAELDRERLRSALSDEGLSIGAYIHSIDNSELQNSVLIKMPELSYVGVNFSGCRAIVTARRRTVAPEILQEDVPCDIISDKDGIVESITVKNGTPQVVRGDTVVKGQLLASGYITGRAGSTLQTYADADITLRTWHRRSSKIPRKYAKKEYSGREKEQYSLLFFGKRIKLYINGRIPYAKCDKIIKRTDLSAGGFKLPVSLECSRLKEYEVVWETMPEETAYEILNKSIGKSIAFPDESCEVCDVKLKTASDGDFAYSELVAECIEKAGIRRPMPKE